MSAQPYLLDSNIIVALIRGRALGTYLNERFDLVGSPVRPLVCRVTHAELGVLAEFWGWGVAKRAALERALQNLVTVEIDAPAVLDAYVAVDITSQRHPSGSRNMGKNDVWIAAAARAAGAYLLTADKDFDHLFESGLVAGEYVAPEETSAA